MLTPSTDFENGLLPALKGIQGPMLLVQVNGIFLEIMELVNQLLHRLPELKGATEFFERAGNLGWIWRRPQTEDLKGQQRLVAGELRLVDSAYFKSHSIRARGRTCN